MAEDSLGSIRAMMATIADMLANDGRADARELRLIQRTVGLVIPLQSMVVYHNIVLVIQREIADILDIELPPTPWHITACLRNIASSLSQIESLLVAQARVYRGRRELQKQRRGWRG